jgi:hypothetical protein
MKLEGDANSPTLSIEDSLLTDTSSTYIVNGDSKTAGHATKSIAPIASTWTIERRSKTNGCREISANNVAYPPVVLKSLVFPEAQVENGIVVGPAKVFDVVSLQRMLNTTASQLAAISGFNASSISAAFGNLQGITRDTSYFNAQLTTAPTASIGQQNTLGTSTPNTTQTTTPVGSTIVTLQCPDGSLPTIGSSTTLGGCAVVPITGSAPGVSAYSPVTNGGGTSQGVLTTTPAGSTVTNTGSTTSAQNQTTTTTPSVSGVAPSALTSNSLTAPNNIGVGSADILAEQVQLNSQITTLRLLLQGALSDQYLLRNSRAVGERQQTTLGFTVALDPPRQYKHAVAEVHVIIVPTGRSDSPSIMNLLPSEKTYNVAKVTSNQKAFGAGAVIEPVSFGFSTGKSKDRLYLAKDTDTLALQFPVRVASTEGSVVRTPLPQKIHDLVKSAVEDQMVGECGLDSKDGKVPAEMKQMRADMELAIEDATALGAQPIAFGWQFRPVLGADYVEGGDRQLFAQLALGAGLNDSYIPNVYIETVWREYNSHSQVVGAMYRDSCTLTEQPAGGVDVLSQAMVRDMSVSDLGGGQLKLSATGSFYSSSISVLSAQNTLAISFFDGATLEAFGNAHDLMVGGDLKIVGQNGQNSSFGIATNQDADKDQSCGLSQVTARAVPRPDGNSKVYIDLTLGPRYSISAGDLEPNPLVLIGGQVYGLRETPFVNVPADRCVDATPATSATPATPARCQYQFLAPTTSLRNGQTFLVRDLAWDQMQMMGHLEFLPSFTAAKALALQAPSFGVQVTNQSVIVGQQATFSVTAAPQPLTYQWARNGIDILGATGPSYETQPVGLANNGERFTVAVTNPVGTITSNVATLIVTAAVLNPSITKQPASQAVRPGQKVTISVEAAGTSPLTYQWRRNGIDISGGGSSYTIPAADASENGAQFSVVVSHGMASTVSTAATLTVYGTPIATSEANDSTGNKTATTADEISGFDFLKFGRPCLGTFDSACLRIFADSTPININGFTIVSNNLALVKGVPAGTKSLWFQVSWTPPNPPDPDAMAVWELAVQKTTEDNSTSIVGSPAFVYIGDIQTISFSSSAFSVFSTATGPIPMTFGDNQITGIYDSTKKVLKVQTTAAMTSVPGHKEIMVTVPAPQGSGSPQPTTLSFDVIRQIIKE